MNMENKGNLYFQKRGHLTLTDSIPQLTMFLYFGDFHLLCKLKILKDHRSNKNF